MARSLHIKNALIWDSKNSEKRDLYTTDVVVVHPPLDADVIDLDGYAIFPGLVNAHDHLELNHYPRSKFREVYDNAHQWGADMNIRLDTEPYKSRRAYPLKDRLFIGGLKNLLSGATTVAHHNPPHKDLFRRDFPVRVLKKYGWAHSLHFSTDEEIVRSYRNTPKDWAWFIHLAEGTDDVAAAEYQRLKTLGCVQANTVIVHGVGMTEEDRMDAAQIIRGLVWCPSTNVYLLNHKPYDDVLGWYLSRWPGCSAVGSDSRLTSSGDLLAELSWAGNIRAVTIDAANIIGWPQVGNLNSHAHADWIALQCPIDKSKAEHNHWNTQEILQRSHRADLALVVKGGIPQVGDPDLMAKFSDVQIVRARLDGVEKAIHIDLARRIIRCNIKEPGLEVDALPQGKRFWII